MVEYIIVKCGACDTAQVIQKPRQFSSTTGKKRTVRWACKLCGEAKQSIVKIYASSEMPSELRPMVQQLNVRRAAAHPTFQSALDMAAPPADDSPYARGAREQRDASVAASHDWQDSPPVGPAGHKRGRASSWERYMAAAEDTADSRGSSHAAGLSSRAHETSLPLPRAPASPALPSEAEVLAMFD